MTTTITPSLVFRALTPDGSAPLAGGKLWTYQAGTTTPLATYTDASGSTQAPNPIILDANGQAQVWLGPQAYKLNLLDASDVQQPKWPIDNYRAFAWSDVQAEVAAGVAGIDARIQNQTPIIFTTAGTAPNYTGAPNPPIADYQNGQEFEATFHADGTTGSNTINISGKGSKLLKQYGADGSKQPAVIKSFMIARIRYDGTDFVVMNALRLSPAFGVNSVSAAYTVPPGTSKMVGVSAVSPVMINPTGTGSALVIMSGIIDSGGGNSRMGIRLGTGTPPSAGSAEAGVWLGTMKSISRYDPSSFTISGIATGLTSGPYWVDLYIDNQLSASVVDVFVNDVTAMEI